MHRLSFDWLLGISISFGIGVVLTIAIASLAKPITPKEFGWHEFGDPVAIWLPDGKEASLKGRTSDNVARITGIHRDNSYDISWQTDDGEIKTMRMSASVLKSLKNRR